MVIEARQRSPLGAFYRTSLGAFGPGAPVTPVLDTWEVDFVDAPDSTPLALRADCDRQTLSGVTFYGTGISPVTGGLLSESLVFGPLTFTGQTSGAVHVWPGSPCPIDFRTYRARQPSALEYGPYTGLEVTGVGGTIVDLLFWLETASSGFIVGELVDVT